MRFPIPHPLDVWSDWALALVKSLDISAVPAPHYFPPTVLTVSPGTLSAGTAADLAAPGGSSVVVTEVVNTPGFTVEVECRGVTYPLGLVVYGYYNGNAAHEVDVEAYNYDTAAWDVYGTMPSVSSLKRYSFILGRSPDYVSGHVSKMRFNHVSGGVGGHTLNLDYCAFFGHRTV